MSEIENTLCVRSVMNLTPVWIILRKVNDGVYICSCSARSGEYWCKAKHEFVYDSHFKTLHQSKCCESLIDNKLDAPICVCWDNNRDTKLNLKHAQICFAGLCTVEYV